jgi:hypothetical protein
MAAVVSVALLAGLLSPTHQPLRAIGLPAADLQNMFEVLPPEGSRGWMGAESEVSIVIGGGSTGRRALWLFADTYITHFNASANQRQWAGMEMPHSTVAIVECVAAVALTGGQNGAPHECSGRPTYHWRTAEGGAAESFWRLPLPPGGIKNSPAAEAKPKRPNANSTECNAGRCIPKHTKLKEGYLDCCSKGHETLECPDPAHYRCGSAAPAPAPTPTPTPTPLLWPVAGLASRDGKAVVILAQRIVDGLNPVGTTSIVVNVTGMDPLTWPYTTAAVPNRQGTHLAFVSCILLFSSPVPVFLCWPEVVHRGWG